MRVFLVVMLVCVVGLSSTQKLFFKSLKEIEKNKAESFKGFGFKTARQYFTKPLVSKNKLEKERVAVVCPDKKAACPDRNTCCLTTTQSYGCCPLPNAVCCPDRVHCCPAYSRCDMLRRACVGAEFETPWVEKLPAVELDNNEKGLLTVLNPGLKLGSGLGSVICPDGEHECQDGQTCCKHGAGYACCPRPNAVCCSDQVHCCPAGYTCDPAHERCIKSGANFAVDWFLKSPASKKPVAATRLKGVKCDERHECPTGNTCCKKGDKFGCCPMPNAVCCPDGDHCCPEKTVCDSLTTTCNATSEPTVLLKNIYTLKVSGVKCDATHECLSDNTCCKLEGGDWGCCPLPNAVCCPDHSHCCPSGTTCDPSEGKCDRGGVKTDWFEKQPAINKDSVKCDATHECPIDNTCCKLEGGEWGCCPLPNAVCCPDHTHCCPSGTTCDPSEGKCDSRGVKTDWFKKKPAIHLDTVKCDATHECPIDNTCCKLEGGEWGCCPLPNAVCCPDHTHCCPSGTTCDPSEGKCDRGGLKTDWFEKQPAIHKDSVKCDATHECPSGNTCCKLEGGDWGCCPFSDAVCCDDHTHCCPSGSTCDTSGGKCIHGNRETAWLKKQAAQQVQASVVKEGHICTCGEGETCCTATKMWGCCPYKDAVCCADGEHCCPQGTRCGLRGACLPLEPQLPWVEKLPAVREGIVKCDDTSYCPDGNTCCMLSSGEWGCCPLKQAVCCNDGIHCCPNGYTCDTAAGKCTMAKTSVTFTQVKVNKMADDVQMVICPDGSECQNAETCCKMDDLSGSYGCCPLPNAVCCQDNQHCCPHGYRCDLTRGACVKGMVHIPWIETIHRHKPITPAVPQGGVASVPCPGSVSCPDSYSCCDDGKGSSLCCPYATGVCCDDHQHCCPHGYICDQGPNICRIPESGKAASSFLQKLQAKPGAPLI